MRGSGWASASSASVTGRSGSYWTAMRASAAAAVSSLVAATAATGSPTKRTLSSASACSSWLTGRMPNGIGRSFPVSTAFTPGALAARDVSIERMRAWGWGLRSSLAKSMRGRNRSSANFVTPVTFAVASTLRWAFPTTRSPEGFLPDAIQGLRRRLRVLSAHPSRRQLDGFVDLDVTGAAAEVARERLLDRVAGRTRARREECLGGEEERRCAIAALCRAQLGECLLEGMERAARRHPLDRLDPAPGAGEAEHQTGEDRRAVDEHGAGTALAQLAAVLRARQPRIFAQHFEQRLVGRERDLDGLAVQLQCDFRLGVGRGHGSET